MWLWYRMEGVTEKVAVFPGHAEGREYAAGD